MSYSGASPTATSTADSKSNTARSSYIYTPLPAHAFFRTLELLPSRSPSSPLQGRLCHHATDKAPEYEALSYVWGAAAVLLHDIELGDGGGCLPITVNLHSALVRLRQPDTSRLLWVDSLCINQTDDAEKGEQVGRMGLYYQSATKVLVYLGEERDGSETVPSFVDDVCAAKAAAGPVTDLRPLLPPDDDVRWQARAALFLRPWWGRYWIIQETLKAPQLQILCGAWTLDWDVFASAMQVSSQVNVLVDETGPRHEELVGFRPFTSLVVMRRTLRREQTPQNIEGQEEQRVAPHMHLSQWHLIDLLERCRPSQCTDKRDYIYGVLGLCVEEHSGKLDGIAPSYTESHADTYTRYAKLMVEWGDGIKLLYSACHGLGGSPGVPSWVPNWAARDVPFHVLSPRDDGGSNPYYCAASAAAPYFRLSTVADHVVVRGIVVGTISEVGATAPNPGAVEDGRMVHQRDFEAVVAACTDLLKYGTLSAVGFEAVEMVWRTLCCNVDVESGREAPAEFQELFFALIKFIPVRTAMDNGGQPPEDFNVALWNSTLESINEVMEMSNAFLMRAAPMCLGRRVAVTDSTRICQVPPTTEAGDMVFLPFGSAVPFVLGCGLDGFVLKGECYVHGIMKGELLQRSTSHDVQEITLI